MERGGGDIFLFYFTCLKAGIHHTLPSLSISCNHHPFGPKQSTNGNFGTASGENTRRRAWCTPIYQSLGHQEEDRYHTPQGLLDFHWVDMSCSSCVRELKSSQKEQSCPVQQQLLPAPSFLVVEATYSAMSPLTKSLPNLCQVETVLHAKLWMHRSFCIYTFIKHTRNSHLS